MAKSIAQAGERGFVAKVQPIRITAVGIEIGRQCDLVMMMARMRHGAHDIGRIGDHLLDRDIGIGDAVDEAAVRAIFQQAADQIG